MKDKKVFIGSDHGGFKLKSNVCAFLRNFEIAFEDCGTKNEEPVDYPEIAKIVSQKVKLQKEAFGILICGTGLGMAIAANKFSSIRAVCCTGIYEAKMARKHNNANVLCLGGRILGVDLVLEIIQVFLNTEFSGEERHLKRIGQIEKLEK